MRLRVLGSGLALAAMLANPGLLHGQVTIGGRAGVTFSNFTGDDVEDSELDTKTGFFVGASLGVPLGGILGLGTGAYYVQKGVEEAGGDASLDLAYLEIPALLQVVVTGPERPVGIGLFLGPSFAFNLSCDGSSDGGESADCSDRVKGFDLGALFGAGVSFAAGERATISVNGGLDLGLTSTDDTGADEDIKNQAYFLGVGVSWPVGG
ncbi:MAG TPA: porin family protein [Longimicrobiales bacterium]|nr:porin family protein [Longimicrobiales bacterium]